MAKKKWIVLPGGRIKRWKDSKRKTWVEIPPHWYRNHLNRKERQRNRTAIFRGKAQRFPHLHPRVASWYW